MNQMSYPMEIADELGHWDIELKSGEHLLLSATGYSRVKEWYDFKVLMNGSPPFEVTIARVPVVLVASIDSS